MGPASRRDRRAAFVVVAVGALLLAPVAWSAALHCDETTVLRHVTRFAHGDLGRPGRPGLLWLLLSPLVALGDPVLITRAARLVGLAAAVCTLGLTATLAQQTSEGEARGRPLVGAAAAALLLGAMAWHGHGWEVRTDSFVAPMTLLLALQLWRERLSLGRAAALGLLVGAMGLISQKSIYNVAAVSLGACAFTLAAQGTSGLRARGRTLGVVAAVALALVGAWYAGMSVVSGRGAEFVESNLELAARTGFGGGRSLGRKLITLWGAMKQGAPLWTLATLGAALGARTRRERPGPWALTVASLAMLATIFLHRGVFLYYVASFEPLLAALAAVPVAAGLSAVETRRGRPAAWAVAGLAILGLAALSAPRWRAFQAVGNTMQLDLMREAHEAFPEPAPYWDQIGLVPGSPEITFFGTAPVRKRFRAAGGPSAFIERARARAPRFFLRDYMSRDRHMTGTERRWHWRQFVPYRPNLYLAGGRRLVTPAAAGRGVRIEILVAGDYTVWFRGGWRGTATVDGDPVEHREVVSLPVGAVVLDAVPTQGTGELWLILGAGPGARTGPPRRLVPVPHREPHPLPAVRPAGGSRRATDPGHGPERGPRRAAGPGGPSRPLPAGSGRGVGLTADPLSAASPTQPRGHVLPDALVAVVVAHLEVRAPRRAPERRAEPSPGEPRRGPGRPRGVGSDAQRHEPGVMPQEPGVASLPGEARPQPEPAAGRAIVTRHHVL
jgi:hypothetical protein